MTDTTMPSTSNEVAIKGTNASTIDGKNQSERFPIMELPAELRLDIYELALSEHVDWCLAKSESGKTLLEIVNRLLCKIMKEGDSGNRDRLAMSMLKVRPFISEISPARYKLRLEVPQLLQTNGTLRGESLDLYLRRAKAQLIRYEDEHLCAVGTYMSLMLTLLAARHRHFVGPQTVRALEETMRGKWVELTERCLRWYALRESCKLLGETPEDRFQSTNYREFKQTLI